MSIRTFCQSVFFGILLALPASGLAQETPVEASPDAYPDVKALLSGFEDNLNFESRTTKMTMTVATSRRTRVYEMKAFGRGLDDAAIEYLSPARDAGTRMLRKGDEMWLYMPSVEKTQKISGHMLRQGMMGSDMSYEDMTGSTDWDEVYDGKITGKDKLDGRDHWVVELIANDDSVSYPKRISWVDVETLIPSKQELYALSGMLVKTWEMSEVQEFENGRRFPMKMRIIDKLKEGSYTEIHTTELDFKVELTDEVFSMRWLER